MTAALVTERLALRVLTREDAGWITEHIVNPNVQQWLSGPPHPFTRVDAQDWLDTAALNPSYRAILADGEPLGVMSIAQNVLGYWLKESAWGQGYATEAARALIDWHFAQGGRDLTSGWHMGNARSSAVLRKLGFRDLERRTEYAPVHGCDVEVQKVTLSAPLRA
ncbi:MAG: GNAT family N-acetyltransferase [Pseudomonadota bacterium]